MRDRTADLLHRIETISPTEWEAVAHRARELQVGGSQWEAAWLAARRGHPSAIAAQSRALSVGASPLAASAFAGAVAAQQARADLTRDQYATLIQPVAAGIAPGQAAVRSGAWRFAA
ncbi:MAG: hypothetical protein E6I88_04635 [Chloroflexi bacterium]|nr:MAG: hypothetical protein E6I88_04635 [Chloroflexota bacterium]TME47044.1 MAG: hypothetical protein E6I56_05265 [Chloroflexota bacterium]